MQGQVRHLQGIFLRVVFACIVNKFYCRMMQNGVKTFMKSHLVTPKGHFEINWPLLIFLLFPIVLNHWNGLSIYYQWKNVLLYLCLIDNNISISHGYLPVWNTFHVFIVSEMESMEIGPWNNKSMIDSTLKRLWPLLLLQQGTKRDLSLSF